MYQPPLGEMTWPGHELGLVAGEIDGGPGDVVGIADPLQRRLRGDALAAPCRAAPSCRSRSSPARSLLTRMLRDGNLVRERPREAEDRRLGRRVGHAAGAAEGAHDARHVDDRARHLRVHDLQRLAACRRRCRRHARPACAASRRRWCAPCRRGTSPPGRRARSRSACLRRIAMIWSASLRPSSPLMPALLTRMSSRGVSFLTSANMAATEAEVRHVGGDAMAAELAAPWRAPPRGSGR